MPMKPPCRHRSCNALLIGVLFAVIGLCGLLTEAASAAAPKPTVVLVHGAWEQGSSMDAVAVRLRAGGYPVVVPELPLRTLANDSTVIASFLNSIEGPIVLAGHSYGGTVITRVAGASPKVKALVYIAGFAPDRGESTFSLDLRVPGSLIPAALIALPFAQIGGDVGADLYINQPLYRTVMAGDVAAPAAAAMAAEQRPVTLAALMGQSDTQAWKTIPSWYMVARRDNAIPPATQRFMAKRARATTVEIDSSHAAHVAHADAVTDLIVAAAGAIAPPGQDAVGQPRLSPSALRRARSGRTAKARVGRVQPVRGISRPGGER